MTEADIPASPGAITNLSRASCIKLLKEEHVGRVAFEDSDGPQLLPVTYLYWNDTIVFRTSDHGILSRLRHRSKAAFEIDGVDADLGTAWSVVVRGVAQEVVNPYELNQVWTNPELVPIAAGNRPLVIAIEPRTITGRALSY